jgi:hypothetical protein
VYFTLLPFLGQFGRVVKLFTRSRLTIFDDNRLKYLLNVRNFSLNIKLCLKNDQFKSIYIVICHNDNDCSEYRLLHILFSHLSRSKMKTIVFVWWKNRLMLILIMRHETYYEFSWMTINLIDKHFLILFWFYTIQFICDLTFWMIARFWCFL